MTGDHKHIPCENCGIDLFHRDCEETTAHIDAGSGFTFQGETPTREVPAYICPECGEVTPL